MIETGSPAQLRQALSRPEKIHALTSLRFFAALAVVLYHTYPLAFPEMADTFLARFISFGYVAVSFFFLLSGYILAVVYLRAGRPIEKSSFYLSRFARIYPLFLWTLVVDTPDLLLRRVHLYGWLRSVLDTIATFGAHLFMLQAWLAWLQGIDPPNWSLSVETVFYVAFPFIGYYFWKMKGARLWIWAIALWIMGQVVATVFGPYFTLKVARFFPLFHIWTFPVGILLAKWQHMRREQYGSSPKTNVSVIGALVVATLAYLAVVEWGGSIPLPNVNSGLLLPVFAVVIWACSANASSLPARLLSAKWLVVLGEASYGLYLIHMPLHHLFLWMHWETSKVLWPVYLVSCVVLSLMSFYWIETPSRKWILKRFRSRTKETMELASDAQ
jgi:peptidoglycan/LPS O-acetylase OafA/YrhL